MRKNIRCRLLISTALLSLPAIATATETVIYTYDELGRLTGSATTGTVNGGVQTSTSFDPAGNRAGYRVSGVGGVVVAPLPPPPPPPPPSPPPPNQPPVFVVDPILSVACNASGIQNVLGNDTDPEGDLPLSLTLTGGTGINFVSVSGPQSITFNAPAAPKTTYAVTYTIRDSRGATATGTLDLKVTGSAALCTGGPPPIQATGTGG